jgi:hypothetical protein
VPVLHRLVREEKGGSMTLRLQCDRCSEVSEEEIKPFAMRPSSISETLVSDWPTSFLLPTGWSHVLGRHLCSDCTHDIESAIFRTPAKFVEK